MSRKEIVVVVSRAFAGMQLVAALIEMTYLPERMFSLHHHSTAVSVLSVSADDSYWKNYYQVEIVFLVARILFLLTLTVVFWKCGPWIERLVFFDQPANGVE